MQRLMIRAINIWPPILGAGIRVKWSPDNKAVDVEMKLRFWNRNYVGTHYGGSLYSMTDPFYMLMLMKNLGSDYIVWDKAASIRFRKPGKGRVRAEFRLTDEQLEDIRSKLKTEAKYEPTFLVASEGRSRRRGRRGAEGASTSGANECRRGGSAFPRSLPSRPVTRNTLTCESSLVLPGSHTI